MVNQSSVDFLDETDNIYEWLEKVSGVTPGKLKRVSAQNLSKLWDIPKEVENNNLLLLRNDVFDPLRFLS